MVRGSRKLPGLCERAGGRPWTLPGQAHATDIPGTFAVRSVCSVHLVQWGRNALVTQTKGLGRSWCAAQSTRSGPGRIPGSRRARRGQGTPSSVRRGARGENCGAQKNTDLDGDAVNVRYLLADVLRQQRDRKRPTLHPGHVPAQPSRQMAAVRAVCSRAPRPAHTYRHRAAYRTGSPATMPSSYASDMPYICAMSVLSDASMRGTCHARVPTASAPL